MDAPSEVGGGGDASDCAGDGVGGCDFIGECEDGGGGEGEDGGSEGEGGGGGEGEGGGGEGEGGGSEGDGGSDGGSGGCGAGGAQSCTHVMVTPVPVF